MSRFLKLGLALIGCLCFAVPAFGQDQIFYVDDDAGGNTYPTLANAVATARTFTGNHIIIVSPHSGVGVYTDINIGNPLPVGPGDIDSIKGDGTGDVVFDGSAGSGFDEFIRLWPGLKVSGLRIQNYPEYGIAAVGVTGCTVTDNCFFNNNGVGVQAYDNTGGNLWEGNFWDDYTDVTFPFDAYGPLGGGGESDLTPGIMENNPVGGPVTSIEVGAEFTLSFNFSMSGCDATQRLGGYEFTATWDPLVLELVALSEDYDYGYLGPADGSTGALYTNIDDVPAGTLTFAATNFSNPGSGNGPLAHARFRAIATTTSAAVTLGSSYVDGAGSPIGVRSGATAAFAIVDTQKPVVTSVTQSNQNGANTYSLVPGKGLSFGASATDNYCLYQIYYSVDAGGFISAGLIGGGTSGSVSGVAVSLVALANGPHTLHVYAQDCAPGFLSSTPAFDVLFNVDNTGPVLTSVVLKDADGCATDVNFTNSPTVKGDLTDDGTATLMEIFDDGAPGWQTPIPYADLGLYTMLPAGILDGSKHIYYRLTDAYGNIGNQLDDFITLDRVVPSAVSVTLAGGAAKTKDATVSFSVPSWGVGFVEYNISENTGDFVCGNAGWKPIVPGPYTITLSNPDGPKTVSLAVRDEAGNISASPWVSDGIVLDRVAPAAPLLTVKDPSDGETDCTNTHASSVYVDISDADVVYMRVRTNGVGVFLPLAGDGVTPMVDGLYPFTMTPGPASNTTVTIEVELEDNAKDGLTGLAPGNVGLPGSDGIFLDYTAPTLASMDIADAVAGGAPLANSDWTNSLTVNLNLTGLSDPGVGGAVTHLLISEDGIAYLPYPYIGNPHSYTHSSTPQCVSTGIWVKAVDCAGNESPVATDIIYFDLVNPTFSAFSGPPLTNTLAVTLSLTSIDVCTPPAYQMRISNLSDFSTGTGWIGFTSPYPWTLLAGDGNHTVYAEVADAAGNVDARTTIINVDMTAPSGSATLRQNPVASAMLGWTNSLTDNGAWNITQTGGAVEMYLDFPGTLGWVPFAATYPLGVQPNILLVGAPGLKTVNIYFRDAALNQSPAIPHTITYNNVPPSTPVTLYEAPGGSIVLTWTPVPASFQSYILRYNFNGDYPEYGSNNPPPPPGNKDEGIFIAEVTTSPYSFASTLGPDIYSVSLFTRDNAGNVSLAPAGSASGTNYFLGDFMTEGNPAEGDPDGCISFVQEFGAMAEAYNTQYPLVVPNDANFNPHLDIAPIDPLSYVSPQPARLGNPIPDNKVNFEDLIIFALNYLDVRCPGGGGGKIVPGQPRSNTGLPIAMTANLPSSFAVGDEVSIPVSIENASAIVGFQVVLDYNENDFELVGVNAGEAFTSTGTSFFYYDRNSSNIDVSGALLSANAMSDGVLFEVRLRSRTNSGIELSPVTLTYRDDENHDIAADFGVRVTPASAAIPTTFALTQNYPNPFNAGTVIQLRLPTESDYTLVIYNLLGQSVAAFSGHSPAGTVNVNWDANDQPSGLYLYRMTAGSFQQTRKMTLLK